MLTYVDSNLKEFSATDKKLGINKSIESHWIHRHERNQLGWVQNKPISPDIYNFAIKVRKRRMTQRRQVSRKWRTPRHFGSQSASESILRREWKGESSAIERSSGMRPKEVHWISFKRNCVVGWKQGQEWLKENRATAVTAGKGRQMWGWP